MGNKCLCRRREQSAVAPVSASGVHSRRSVRITAPSQESVAPPAATSPPATAHERKYTLSDTHEVDEGEFQRILRGYTRKSFSSVDLGGELSPRRDSNASRGPRRDSRIDDREVLKLIAKKDNNSEQQRLLKEATLGGDVNLEVVADTAPELLERVQKRRQTMEKLDIFSPDTETDRLEELYDATEKLLANEDAKK